MEHSVDVDEEQVVSVDVTIVSHAVVQLVDVVVEHLVDVDEEQLVSVDVMFVTEQDVQ